MKNETQLINEAALELSFLPEAQKTKLEAKYQLLKVLETSSNIKAVNYLKANIEFASERVLLKSK